MDWEGGFYGWEQENNFRGMREWWYDYVELKVGNLNKGVKSRKKK